MKLDDDSIKKLGENEPQVTLIFLRLDEIIFDLFSIYRNVNTSDWMLAKLLYIDFPRIPIKKKKNASGTSPLTDLKAS